MRRDIGALAVTLLLLLLAAPGAMAQDCEEAYKDIEVIDDTGELLRRVELHPDCGDLYVALGDVSYDQELWLDAEKWYKKSLEFYPEDSFIQDRHAEALRKMPIALDDAANVDVDKEIQKRGLGGTKGLPPLSLEINFATGSAALEPAAHDSLDVFATIITKKFGDYSFEVQGHTDNVGAPASNMKLSERRAQSVRDYLVNTHGIDPARLRVKGFGESRPIASNATDDGKARNRRVQFQGFK